MSNREWLKQLPGWRRTRLCGFCFASHSDPSWWTSCHLCRRMTWAPVVNLLPTLPSTMTWIVPLGETEGQPPPNLEPDSVVVFTPPPLGTSADEHPVINIVQDELISTRQPVDASSNTTTGSDDSDVTDTCEFSCFFSWLQKKRPDWRRHTGQMKNHFSAALL